MKYITHIESQTASYRDDPETATVDDHTVAERYERAQRFLQEHGKAVDEKLEVLPFITEGIISAPRAHGIYRLHDCLVENRFVPHWGGVTHELWIGGRLVDARRLYKEFRNKASDAYYYRRWGVEWQEKIYQVRKRIDITACASPKSLEEALTAAAVSVKEDGSGHRGK